MSRTIRDRHNRGRDHSVDIDAVRKRYEMYFDAGMTFYHPERVAKYIARDEKWNAKLHRDGLHSYGWKKFFRVESAGTDRAHWRVFFAVEDWDRPYPHLREAADKWSWD